MTSKRSQVSWQRICTREGESLEAHLLPRFSCWMPAAALQWSVSVIAGEQYLLCEGADKAFLGRVDTIANAGSRLFHRTRVSCCRNICHLSLTRGLLFSVFGEDALVNVSVEKKDDNDGKLAGYIRIRSKTQGIALSLGDRITSVQRGLSEKQ